MPRQPAGGPAGADPAHGDEERQAERHAQGQQGFGVHPVSIGELDQDGLEGKADRRQHRAQQAEAVEGGGSNRAGTRTHNLFTTCSIRACPTWLDGLEGAFYYFDGLPEEVLLYNVRALVERHDPATRVVVFHPRLLAFARYWGFQPRACAPYRARTKGKDERGVGYVKHHAIAGRMFASWAALEAHLREWLRTVADVRTHGTTGEPPLVRFERAEAMTLRPLNGRPPFHWTRELTRRVHTDSCVEVDTHHYSVPWRLIGETVTVQVRDDQVCILHAGTVIARHLTAVGRHQWVVEPTHLDGIIGAPRGERPTPAAGSPAPPRVVPALLRPLADYEAAAGGGW